MPWLGGSRYCKGLGWCSIYLEASDHEKSPAAPARPARAPSRCFRGVLKISTSFAELPCDCRQTLPVPRAPVASTSGVGVRRDAAGEGESKPTLILFGLS